MMISDSVDRGDWKPIFVSKEGIRISHLLFADDIMLFAESRVS